MLRRSPKSRNATINAFDASNISTDPDSGSSRAVSTDDGAIVADGKSTQSVRVRVPLEYEFFER
jgi:hypothetical protein